MSSDPHAFRAIDLSLDQCIKCNICVSACPVYAVTDLFPGPKYAGPQGGRFRMPKQPSPDWSVDYCSGCRVCNLICPAGVKIAELNALARADLVAQGKVGLRTRLRNKLLASSETLGKLGVPVAPLANAFLASTGVRRAIETMLGIHHRAPLPKFAFGRFTDWFKRHKCINMAMRKVVYFHGCATQYYEPRIGRAAVRLLEAFGFQVVVPAQYCCGLPLLSNGEFKAARAYHSRNVRSLVEYARQGIPIVGTSTSCTLTLKEEAPELLGMADEDTLLVARNTYDFNEFVLHLLEQGPLPGRGENDPQLIPIPMTLGYHMPCQYRAHRLGKPALEVLSLIPELTIVESHADCCGVAGTYGYKVEKYDVAMQVGVQLFEFTYNLGAPLVLCDSETCRWQITHATGLPTIHPAELLAAAYGLEVENPLADILNRAEAGK